MFDHEKMSEKDQQRYAEALEQSKKWPLNCGGPLDPDQVNAGLTWDSDTRKWVTHQSLGATVTKAPKGWQALFSEFNVRYAYPRTLKVVSIVYDWKVFN